MEVRIPAPAITLQPNQRLQLAKAQPGGEWLVLGNTELAGGVLSADVDSFSFFTTVVMTYPLPLTQLEPLRPTQVSLDCGTSGCANRLGPVTATYSVTTNNGATPDGCTNENVYVAHAERLYGPGSGQINETSIPRAGGAVTRTAIPTTYGSYAFEIYLKCSGYRQDFGSGYRRQISWQQLPQFPFLQVMSAPAQLDVVEGLSANLDVLMGGGAVKVLGSSTYELIPSSASHATIDWQRSDDDGASWRTIARSFQHEGNSLPFGSGMPWRPWSTRHGFVAATTDQGALIRVQACYTVPPQYPAYSSPPCVTGNPTRLNVLQQSALPVIIDAPVISQWIVSGYHVALVFDSGRCERIKNVINH